MEKIKGSVAGYLAMALAILGTFASEVMAAVDLSAYEVDVTTVETLAGIVLVGLAAMWAIRKLIKTVNRS
jgi:hypothetical protein